MVGVGSLVSVGGGNNGSGGGSSSGIQAINSQAGPAVVIVGVNGISVSAGGNVIVVDAAGISGVTPRKFAADFTAITSGQFVHSLGTRDVIVQVYQTAPIAEEFWPDRVVRDTPDVVSLLFNRPATGRVVILG
jgi:hypothetical protein